MAKSKKNKNKPKLNLTVREEQRNKLEQMASLENRSVSNLIEVMADERWERLVEQQGVAYAKTVAEAMNLKTRRGQTSRPREIAPSGSRSCRREKNAKAKTAWLKFSRSLSGKHFAVRFTVREIFHAFWSDGRKFRVRGNEDPSSFSSQIRC